jgi:cobalt/nickel transport system permease protein
MHMADALISPAVGGTMWLASAGLTSYASRKIDVPSNGRLIPLMGVSGAFVFAAQMINFGIPATGSSGHLGGGLLLAVLLGPYPALVVMASILTVQALVFADGGLLALGCNIFNLGVLPCLVAYPLLLRPLLGTNTAWPRLFAGCLVAALVGVELGAFGVVLQTAVSGRAALPFDTFLLLMLPIHLAIAVVEGLATAAILAFIWHARPELRPGSSQAASDAGSVRPVALGLLVVALIVGGCLSWFASTHPDGLEWSIERAVGSAELPATGPVHGSLARLQDRTAVLPDYDLPSSGESSAETSDGSWPAVSPGGTVSGIVGSLCVLVLAAALGWVSRVANRRREQP